MRLLDVERGPLREGQEPLQPVREGDWDKVIDEPVLLREGGRGVLVFTNEVEEDDELLAALQGIRYGVSFRASGMRSQSRTFGYLPRVTLRRDYCTESALATEHPRQNAVFRSWAQRASGAFEHLCPEEHAQQARLLEEKVRPDWRLPGGVFTSGIANHNNELRYHYDKGNFRGSWSAMYALSRGVRGGLLVLPAWRVAFRFHRPSLIIFDGQANLHGVSEIKQQGLDGYRYTVVFYAMAQMCNCLPVGEELARIRKVKTAREIKRAGL